MRDYRAVATLDALPEGEKLGVRVGEHEIVLFRVAGRIHAFEDACPHQFAPLSDVGACVGGKVLCILHGASFDLESGELLSPPAARGLVRYDVRVEGEQILVAVPDEPPARPGEDAERR